MKNCLQWIIQSIKVKLKEFSQCKHSHGTSIHIKKQIIAIFLFYTSRVIYKDFWIWLSSFSIRFMKFIYAVGSSFLTLIVFQSRTIDPAYFWQTVRISACGILQIVLECACYTSKWNCWVIEHAVSLSILGRHAWTYSYSYQQGLHTSLTSSCPVSHSVGCAVVRILVLICISLVTSEVFFFLFDR